MSQISEILSATLTDSGISVGKLGENLSKQTLQYNQCVRLVLDIGAQIERLKENGYGLLTVSPRLVSKTSSGAFILSDKSDLYYKCTKRGMLDITRPFNKVDSMSPEVLAIDSLPSEVSYTAAYYSLGNLACDVLGIDRDISILKPTKLYFLLERCMQEDPSSRVFLFI